MCSWRICHFRKEWGPPWQSCPSRTCPPAPLKLWLQLYQHFYHTGVVYKLTFSIINKWVNVMDILSEKEKMDDQVLCLSCSSITMAGPCPSVTSWVWWPCPTITPSRRRCSLILSSWSMIEFVTSAGIEIGRNVGMVKMLETPLSWLWWWKAGWTRGRSCWRHSPSFPLSIARRSSLIEYLLFAFGDKKDILMLSAILSCGDRLPSS